MFGIFDIVDPRKNNLRLVIKGMELALSGKAWRERRYSILCAFCTNISLYDPIHIDKKFLTEVSIDTICV